MSRRDGVTLAARSLAVLLTLWVLADISYLPGYLYSFFRYTTLPTASPTRTEYFHHLDLLGLGFLITRIVGLSLMARWLHKGGPEVAEMLLPGSSQDCTDEDPRPSGRMGTN